MIVPKKKKKEEEGSIHRFPRRAATSKHVTSLKDWALFHFVKITFKCVGVVEESASQGKVVTGGRREKKKKDLYCSCCYLENNNKKGKKKAHLAVEGLVRLLFVRFRLCREKKERFQNCITQRDRLVSSRLVSSARWRWATAPERLGCSTRSPELSFWKRSKSPRGSYTNINQNVFKILNESIDYK